MLNLNEFAKEIHANACDKGFWDEPRPLDELCALMISELAEALEEARAGRPMEWYGCAMEFIGNGMCEGGKCDFQKGEPCIAKGHKPEGIAVEMADCAIRIMDYLGSVEYELEEFDDFDDPVDISTAFMRVVSEIVKARIYHKNYFGISLENAMLENALHHILSWFEANGLDFEDIARRKHEYNKTRERLHGKLF